jgi:dihydrofolate reductase
MRKIILGLHMSLDGFISGPNGELDWATWDRDLDNASLPENLARCDAALLGREMYQQFFGYWPTKQAPFFSEAEEEFARWINQAPKYVFSTTLQSVEWNGTLVKGDLVEEVNRLKQQPGKDILAVGGARFPQALARHRLVDEYSLAVSPVVLGAGKALFADVSDTMRLKLKNARSFSSGAVLLNYEPA